jgi:hypothetical protein
MADFLTVAGRSGRPTAGRQGTAPVKTLQAGGPSIRPPVLSLRRPPGRLIQAAPQPRGRLSVDPAGVRAYVDRILSSNLLNFLNASFPMTLRRDPRLKATLPLPRRFDTRRARRRLSGLWPLFHSVDLPLFFHPVHGSYSQDDRPIQPLRSARPTP